MLHSALDGDLLPTVETPDRALVIVSQTLGNETRARSAALHHFLQHTNRGIGSLDARPYGT